MKYHVPALRATTLALAGVAVAADPCLRRRSPRAPRPALSAPTLASPQDDAVATGRPSLIVNNASPARQRRPHLRLSGGREPRPRCRPAGRPLYVSHRHCRGRRAHRFEVNRDLQAGRRYFWRARAMQAGTAGPWSGTFRFRTGSRRQCARRSSRRSTSSSRAEAGAEIEVSATVQDQETAPAAWCSSGARPAAPLPAPAPASAGRAPAQRADRLRADAHRHRALHRGAAGRRDETRENRVTGRATVHVNDSTARNLGARDHLHRRLPALGAHAGVLRPEFQRQLRRQAGGAERHSGQPRQLRQQPRRIEHGAGSIVFYDSGDIIAQSRRAVAGGVRRVPGAVPLRVDRKATGAPGTAVGTCQLTQVYENWQWRLCDSRFLP